MGRNYVLLQKLPSNREAAERFKIVSSLSYQLVSQL